MSQINLAIDGNEANVPNRVGSNVYAFQIIKHLAPLIQADKDIKASVLLSNPALADLPAETPDWQYQLVKPRRLWTQLAAPMHLHQNQDKYHLYFTPGHYAPRLCPIPYVSSVMDLAFIDFPDQFKQTDLIQLKNWTRYSVKQAEKVIAISQFTKQEVNRHYKKPLEDIVTAYPSVSLSKPGKDTQEDEFFKEHQLDNDYFLFIGTLQPRKNLVNLIKAYEIFCKEQKHKQKKKSGDKSGNKSSLPQLVIAGKIGWLADPILEAAASSPVKNNIILTGFVPDQVKTRLYQQALALVLVGLYEGFGIPALESMHLGTIPIVSNSSSLPEVVGNAGLQVNPHRPEIIAEALREVYEMPKQEKETHQEKMQKQIENFSWEKSAEIILNTLIEAAAANK